MANDKDNIATVTYEKTTEDRFDVKPTEQLKERLATPQNGELTSSSPDKLGATGYDPNLQRNPDNGQKPSDIVRRPNLDNRNNSMPQNGPTNNSASSLNSPREGAPDLGKDYGDSRDPGYNGYQNGKDVSNGARPSKDVPEKDNSVKNGVPNQEVPTNSHQGLSKDGDGLEKQDGLKKDKNNETPDESKKEENNNPDLNNAKESDLPKESPDNSNSNSNNKNEKNKTADENESNKKEKDDVNPEAPNTKKISQSQEEGNGYGALKKPNAGNTANSQDGTARARRNLEHTRRMQQGDQESQGASDSKTKPSNPLTRKRDSGGINSDSNNKGSLGSRIKNGLSKLGKNRSKDSIEEGGKGGKNLSKSFTDNIRKIAMFLAAHPYLAIVIGVIVLLFLILIISCIDDESNGGSGKGAHCTYNLKGVSTTGEVKLEGLQVELINCDGTASNYTVLETVDFEKYVLGVALAEIGPGAPDEAFKSQIIAARGFSLSRNSGMCPGNPDGCFYGYNASTGKIRMRACEADQVYWDYEKDIYRQARGAISLYSPEVTSGTLWKAALSEADIARYLELANDVKGKVLVDSSGNVVKTGYVASTSQQFMSKANEGKNYEQILSEVYTDSDGFSNGHCTSYGNIDYGDYVLSTAGTTILHEPIGPFLQSKGTSLEEFNALIASNVEKAGFGTKAGVVAAAVTLIGELGNNYGVKVPYYWGGGHYDGVVIGALDTWGSRQCQTVANGISYNYCGLDCSGFVPWAIKNGGFNMSQNLAGNFKNLPGAKRVSLTNSAVVEPGDLLESEEHVVLVIGIEESSGSYICAEASGNSEGVQFTRRAFNTSGYWGVNMDGYYANNVRSN